jgi:aminoglycoside phosphotransferase (APT) family kinase protein
LLHNDWRLDNMAVAEEDPGRCVAVYDWDMCTVGDPLCDLGTLLCAWMVADEVSLGPGSMPTRAPGFLRRDDAIARYCERTGADRAAVPYYHVFGTFKMGVVLQQIYLRFHNGQTPDARFAGMEAAANALFERASGYRP